MGLKETVKLVVDTKAFEAGIKRAGEKFKEFGRAARGAVQGGSAGRKGGGVTAPLGELSRGGGLLSAAVSGFGATAAIRSLVTGIQSMSDFATQQIKNNISRAAGPAGSFSAELASRGASQIQGRKVIFGLSDAFKGLGAAVFGAEGAVGQWADSVVAAANATTTFAEGVELLVRQEKEALRKAKTAGIKRVFELERGGVIGKRESAAMVRVLQGILKASQAIEANTNLASNVQAGNEIGVGSLSTNAADYQRGHYR